VKGPGTGLPELKASPPCTNSGKISTAGLLYFNSFSLKMGKAVLPSQFCGELMHNSWHIYVFSHLQLLSLASLTHIGSEKPLWSPERERRTLEITFHTILSVSLQEEGD
jgi:hypothetical protein